MSFPRSHRLLAKAEFDHVFDKALKINQKHVLILFKPNHKQHARLGVIVSKRVAHDAVVRNRIKRVVRESFRHYQSKLDDLDIIVIARQQCDTLTKDDLRKGLDHLWERLLLQYPTASSS